MTEAQGSIFILSGEELTLPLAETKALVLTCSPSAILSQFGSRIVLSSVRDENLVAKITQRGAYTRFGGVLVSKSNDLLSLAKSLEISKDATFAVRSYSLPMEKCGELGAQIKSKTSAKVSLENPELLFHVESVPEGYVLGVAKGYKEFSWRERRPRARRFFLPSAIYPKLARALVNLSQVKEGETFLDPFCGTGSLLIESSLMGMRTIGIDITRWIARGALLNLKGFRLEFDSILRGDSRSFLPFSKIHGVSTDVPYGRASSTKGKSTSEILDGFLSGIAKCLDSSRICVVMHPSTIDIRERIEGNSFELQEQHLIYVHRNLTRAISVLRKR